MPQVIRERRDGLAVITLNRPEKHSAFAPDRIVRLRPPSLVGH
jgi:enoyl-CoA hydratase/carnithine racemase